MYCLEPSTDGDVDDYELEKIVAMRTNRRKLGKIKLEVMHLCHASLLNSWTVESHRRARGHPQQILN